MNLLLLKRKKISITIILVCALFYSFKSIVINENEDPFLELCLKSDAYLKHSNTDITYLKNWSRYKRYVSVDNKLVVNTSLGAEKYAFLVLDEFVSNRLVSIKIRTLKADGSIVELDSSIVFRKNPKEKKFGFINYPIPSVEPGDTIETRYVYYEKLKNHELMDYVNLHSSLNSLKSRYSVKTSPELMVRYKSYNGFPEPGIISNDTIVYLQFSMDKINGITDNEFNCLPCERPYLYYSLNKKDSELRTWKDVYNEEFNFLTQPMALDYEKLSYYKRWKRKVIGTAKDSSKYYKLKLLHKAILKDFTIHPVNQRELIKSSGYFLKEDRFDVLSIKRFYRQLLEDLEIDYWAVFGKSKHNGLMDTEYIRMGEFDHIFFAYKNDKNQIKFLYPHNELYMYQIDEIPTSIYNTKAVLVKPNLDEKKRKKDKFIDRDLKFSKVDSVTTATIVLPGMDFKFNYMSHTISSQVDIDNKTANFRSRFKVSGGLFTELKSFYDILSKNEEMSNYYDALSEFEGEDNSVQIDTIISRIEIAKKPFSLNISSEGTLNNVITFVNDSTVSISFDKLIEHNQLENSYGNSELNYYLDYSYSDLLNFYLNFPCDIEVLGLESNDSFCKNESGEHFFSIKQSKNNQLQLQSNYKIFKDLIPKEKINQLDSINESVKNLKYRRLIIKLKKN